MTDRVDPHGTLNPDYNASEPRFKVCVRGYEADEEVGWHYKLDVYDRMYLDSDSLTIFSIAAGDSWAEAFATAGNFVEQALATDHCIF